MADKVGYKNPPKYSRWTKGQSGNPSGRPKRITEFKDDLAQELGEIIRINEGGRQRQITKQRALIKALTAGGIKGNARAASLVIGWAARLIEADGAEGAAPGVSEADQKIVEAYLEREVERRMAARKRDDQ